ncbi:hypothetical protein [Rhizobium leguminosarum]|nr:hypothetical protein [Rhizobium leguminosarum]
MTAPAAFSDMISKIRMMTAFDDLFDATLSTILHAGVEMCGGTKKPEDGAFAFVWRRKRKISYNFSFPVPKSVKTILRTALLEIFSKNLLLACGKSDH